jgi:signal peptidase I
MENPNEVSINRSDHVLYSPPPKKPKPKKKESTFGEVIRFVLISLAIVIPIRLYIAEPFIVSGSSMTPTFETGNYLIVDQVTYRFEDPDRGDVVIFHYPKDPTKFFIKRVIGLPGEVVEIKGNQIIVFSSDYPDGLLLDEPYIQSMRSKDLRVTLEEDQYFVMGDNRDASSDSRIWGPLPEDLIVGRALIRLFPISDLSLLPGAHNPN